MTLAVPGPYEKAKRVHQYYRDCLSVYYEFPSLGRFDPEVVRSAASGVDTVRLAEALARQGESGLAANEELALRLMLFTIQQANLAMDRHNHAPDFEIPAGLVESIKHGISRVLALHAHPSYVIVSAQLLYRVKEIEGFLELSRRHRDVFFKSQVLMAILGFVYTMEGDYAEAMNYLQPLTLDPVGCKLPLVALSSLTCRFFLGAKPTSPVSFESLEMGLAGLEESIARLAPMEMFRPLAAPVVRPVVFAACDGKYFYQHALHLAASVYDTSGGDAAVHLHLFSPSVSVLRDVEVLRQRLPGLMIGISVERGECPLPYKPAYYSTVRFVRAYQLLRYYGSEMWLVDADAMFNRPRRDFVSQFAEDAELVLACPDAPFWERVFGAVVYLKPTEVAKEYLARVAQFVTLNIERKNTFWFLDQIALSACDERFTKEHRKVSHVPARRLIDVHQSPLAPIWAVTRRKTGLHAYDSLRERLGEKYGFLAAADRDSLLTYVSRVFAPVFFLQIGAMDGLLDDPIRRHVMANQWHGILVEPLPDMMDRLRAHYSGQAGLSFENVAITEQEEVRCIGRVPVEAIRKAGLPDWMRGKSSFRAELLSEAGSHVVQETVRCITLAQLIAKYTPRKIDVLQIDTEGYDFKVLRQFDFERYRPAIVNFEFCHLDAEEQAEAEALLMAQGYVFYRDFQDVLAVRRDLFFS